MNTIHTTKKLTAGNLSEIGITTTPTSNFMIQGTDIELSRHEVMKRLEREDGITLGELFALAYVSGSNAKADEIKNALNL